MFLCNAPLLQSADTENILICIILYQKIGKMGRAYFSKIFLF